MTRPTFDPLAPWRHMLAQWEAGFRAVGNGNMGQAQFSRFADQTMGQTMDMSVRVQHAMAEMMARYLAAMNMPSRAELAAVNDRLQRIEHRLAHLTEVAERLSAVPAASSRTDAAPSTKEAAGPAPNGHTHPAPEAAPMAAPKPARRSGGAKGKVKAA